MHLRLIQNRNLSQNRSRTFLPIPFYIPEAEMTLFPLIHLNFLTLFLLRETKVETILQ